MNPNFEKLLGILTQKGIDLSEFFLYLDSKVKPPLSNSGSTASQEKIKKIGLKLLAENRVKLKELNSCLDSITSIEESREFLQYLIQKKWIKLEEFLNFDKGLIENDQSSIYKFRSKGESQGEFYIQPDSDEAKYGNYQVMEELARGGMGIVYKAYHPGLNQTFALKVMLIGEALSERALIRFQREIKTTAKLNHANIVQIVDSGIKEAEHYFVMEYIQGKALSEWMIEDYSLRDGITIIQKTLEGLQFAHEHKIIHRDLKPDNIMITEDGVPKIADFGLARDINLDTESQKITQSGAIMGSPSYMSPEQALGEAKNLRPVSDVFSMGVCLYEILTKLRPFTGETFHELLEQIISEEPLPPSRLNSEIHSDLDIIVLKALEKRPEKRYQSAQQFGEDLNCFLEGYPIKAKRASSFEKSFKWAKRNQQLVLITGTTLFLSFFFIGFFRWQEYQEKSSHYRQAFQKAKNLKKEASKLLDKDLKTQQLLKSLTFLNHSLNFFPGDSIAELEKWNLAKEIVRFACEAKNFELADYIASDLEGLLTISFEKQEKIKQQIKEWKTKQLNTHLARLKYWKQTLKEKKLTENLRTNAIFEIAKMSEKEILDELLQILDEGKSYFFSNKKRSSRKDEYYQTMVIALGRLGDKEAGPHLLQILEEMATKLGKKEVKDLAEIDFMVSLFNAITYLKLMEFAPALKKVRWKMGHKKLFWNRTEALFKTLLQNYTFENEAHAWDTPGFYNDRGNTKLNKGDLDGALLDYNEAIKRNPNLFEAYNNRGTIKLGRNDLEGASADLNQAIKLNPTFYQTWVNRGNLKATQGNLAGALLDIKKGYELNPSSDTLCLLGAVLLKFGKLEQASIELYKALELDPQNSVAYKFLGKIKTQQNLFQEAILNLNQSITLNPNEASSYTERGIVKFKLQQFEEALKDLNTALGLNPLDNVALGFRGGVKHAFKDLKGALRDYNKSLQLFPKNVLIYCNRGNVKADLGDIKGALQDYEKALNLSPKCSEAFYGRSRVKKKQGNLKGALTDLNQALFLNPLYFEAYFERGKVSFANKKFKEALADFDKSIGLNANYANSFFERGNVKINLLDFPGALADYKIYIKRKPNDYKVYFNRGIIFLEQNQRKLATVDFIKVLVLIKALHTNEANHIRNVIFEEFPELKPK